MNRETQPAAAAMVLDGRPLVSCIMPTADRRVFVPQAIRYFLRQHYPNRELIIIDDGVDPVADLIPAMPAFVTTAWNTGAPWAPSTTWLANSPVGRLSPIGMTTTGTADWRLDCQVKELLKHPPMTLCGLSRLLFFEPA